MTTRYTDGNVTVTLDDGLEQFVRGLLSAAETEAVRVLEAAAAGVAQAAEGEWYGSKGVTKKTGRSGDIGVTTTFDSAKGEVRVSVGSRDTRTAGKSGKPLPVFVHRPNATSTILKDVGHDEWWKRYKAGRPVGPYPMAYEHNPAANDGRFLLVELVRKPMQAKVKAIIPDLGAAIALKAGGR
jgi:hypothetical protein